MFSAPFSRAFRPPFGPGLSAATSWWLSGGIAPANCIAAYAPKGAASLAASYTNLANPGTYDAAPGVAPTWDTTNGWIGNGSTQYLDTGISTLTSSWSTIVRYSNVTAGQAKYLCGCKMNSGYYGFLPWRNDSVYNHIYFYNVGNFFWNPSDSASGVCAISNTNGYFNSTDRGDLTGGGTAAGNYYIFQMGDLTSSKISCYIQALAIYNITLSSTQISALTTAINAL